MGRHVIRWRLLWIRQIIGWLWSSIRQTTDVDYYKFSKSMDDDYHQFAKCNGRRLLQILQINGSQLSSIRQINGWRLLQICQLFALLLKRLKCQNLVKMYKCIESKFPAAISLHKRPVVAFVGIMWGAFIWSSLITSLIKEIFSPR